jgi:hypothetical protein
MCYEGVLLVQKVIFAPSMKSKVDHARCLDGNEMGANCVTTDMLSLEFAFAMTIGRRCSWHSERIKYLYIVMPLLECRPLVAEQGLPAHIVLKCLPNSTARLIPLVAREGVKKMNPRLQLPLL